MGGNVACEQAEESRIVAETHCLRRVVLAVVTSRLAHAVDKKGFAALLVEWVMVAVGGCLPRSHFLKVLVLLVEACQDVEIFLEVRG